MVVEQLLRPWQRLAIDLAGDRQRELRQPNVERRNHVLGQRRLKVCPNLLRIGRLLLGVIADQLVLLVGVGNREHHRQLDGRTAGQCALHFAELDANAVDLHLGVEAADEFQ